MLGGALRLPCVSPFLKHSASMASWPCGVVSGGPAFSYTPWQNRKVLSVTPEPRSTVAGPETLLHGSKWPISNWLRMPLISTDHSILFCVLAVLNSGWKLNGVPEQSKKLVFMKPLAAEATMNPLCPVVRSLICTLNACWPPPMLASHMWVRTRSPGFINSVWLFGVTVEMLESCGLGGPAGTPFRWMKAKFTGSMQPLFMCPALLASSESMLSAAHQWVLSQLTASARGAKPGG